MLVNYFNSSGVHTGLDETKIFSLTEMLKKDYTARFRSIRIKDINYVRNYFESMYFFGGIEWRF